MDKARIIYLLEGWEAQRLPDTELQELTAFMADDAHREAFTAAWAERFDRDPSLPAFDERLRPYLERTLSIDRVKAPVRRIRWWWAAAAVLMLLLAGTYLFIRKPVVELQAAEVDPGTQKAILTLADGSRIALDSAGSQVIPQGSVTARYRAGELAYEGNSTTLSYNTLTVPRGGQFKLKLPDGTLVWLNADSYIRYPVSFSGKERLVEVSGEAYFEVAGNAAMPFRVQVNPHMRVEVLGTVFNVQAYANEQEIQATLIEGSVRIVSHAASVVLQPGQQAVITGKQSIDVQKADVQKATAWKNGLFNFEGLGLQEAIRQLERWYDIEVVYEGKVPDIRFGGKLSRSKPLSGIIRALEDAGVHFRIEGRKLIVKP